MGYFVATFDDLGDLGGIPLGGVPGHVERALDFVIGQQSQDPAKPADDPEATLGKCRIAGRFASAQPEQRGLGVDVESQRNRNSAAAGPGTTTARTGRVADARSAWRPVQVLTV